MGAGEQNAAHDSQRGFPSLARPTHRADQQERKTAGGKRKQGVRRPTMVAPKKGEGRKGRGERNEDKMDPLGL